jgi:hypothetical protein
MNTLRKWYRHRTAEKVVFTVVGFVVIALLSGWGVWSYVDSQKTYPLGDKLEYVGKSDYGCFYICSAWPGTTYYYATDMTAEEIVGYFKGAKLEKAPYEMSEAYFIVMSNNDKRIYLDLYKHRSHTSKEYTNGSAGVLSIDKTNYNLLKDSL